MNPHFHTDFSISDSLIFVRKSVLIYETIIDCGVDDLKMSEYGIQPSEFPAMAENARATMGGLFTADPVSTSNEDCVAIYQKSFR